MRALYREKKYYCGDYLDVYIFPVFETGKHRPGRRTKRRPSTEAQKKLNRRHSEEKKTRLLHANFTPNDLEIHLTYAQQPETEEEAKRELTNFLRRVRWHMKKLGLGPMKYIAVTERGAKSGRYHHHVTLSGGMDRDELERLWQRGRANSRRLQFSETGLAGLAHYIGKSPIGGKAWNASKGLIDPEPKTRDGRISARKARELAGEDSSPLEFEWLYPGYLLADVGAFHNDLNGGSYINARLYRKDGAFIRARQKRRQKSP